MKTIQLFPHQETALNETREFNRVAYYHDMGLGKTFTGSEKLKDLSGRVNLVICQKSKIGDWVEHFREQYPFNVYSLDVEHDFDEYDYCQHQPLKEYGEPLIGVINYDLIFRRPELLKVKFNTVILDESSLIQNRTSQRSKAILKLKIDNVILLSGTPTGGKYEKLWSQLHLLGWTISEELFFKQYVQYHFDDDEGFPRRVIDGYKNVDRLKKKLRDHGAHFLKTEEVFDLPEQTFISVNVSTSKEYKIFVKDRIVKVDNQEFVGDTALTYDLYKRMLCGSYNQNKMKAFADILESTENRVIVFYNWDHELREIENVCIKLDKPLSMVNGHIKDLSMYEEYENSVTAIQYQAGSMGLNLQKSNVIIYLTPPRWSELYEQSKKRTHRIGQDKHCFYYQLICKDSVEERVYSTLRERKDYTDYLFEE